MRVVSGSDHQRGGDVAADPLFIDEPFWRGPSNELGEGSGEFFGFVIELPPATCQARDRSQVAVGRGREPGVVEHQRDDLCDR